MPGLLLENTDRTFRTLEVVHRSFSYVYDLMTQKDSPGPHSVFLGQLSIGRLSMESQPQNTEFSNIPENFHP